jgi:hypothetical protein
VRRLEVFGDERQLRQMRRPPADCPRQQGTGIPGRLPARAC